MLDFLTNIGSSGIVGLFGTAFGMLGSYFEKKQELKLIDKKMDQQKVENAHELKVMEFEATSAENLSRIESEMQLGIAEQKSISDSYKSDKRTYSKNIKTGKISGFLMFLVDMYRGIIRPSITTYSLILLTLIFFKFSDQISKLSPEQINNILLILINCAVFLACKSIAYWFGSRGVSYDKISKSMKG